MPPIELTSFQTSAEALIAELLRDAGLTPASREVLTEEAPFYNPGAPLLIVHLTGAAWEIWIHDDEVGFRVGDATYRAEALDFANTGAQLEHVAAALRRALTESAA